MATEKKTWPEVSADPPSNGRTLPEWMASLPADVRAEIERGAEVTRDEMAGRRDAVLAAVYLSGLPYVPNAGAVRRIVGRTQAEVAAVMGTDQSSYSKWERKPTATVKQLRDFAKAVGGELVVMLRFPNRKPVCIDTGVDPLPIPVDEWALSLDPVPPAEVAPSQPAGRPGRMIEVEG